MATDATPNVVSSTTAVLEQLSPTEMKNWRLTGDLPEVKVEEPPKKLEAAVADPPPAAKEAVTEPPAKAAETPAEPVPAKAEPPKPEKNAESRIKELLADRKQLQAKLDEYEKASKAQPVVAKKDEAIAKPQRTDVDEKGQLKFPTEEAYEEARDEWVYKRASEETRKQIAKDAEAQRASEQQKLIADKWLNGMQIARTKYADLDTVLKTDEKGLCQAEECKGIKSGGILDGWLVDSDFGIDLLYHLAKTPGEVAKIQAMNPFAATRYLTKLEDKFSPTPVSSKAEEVHPARSNVSRAPAPPTNISGKATAPVDEIESALKTGDTAAYFKAANAEDMQKRKRA
jgi:hypothetical protein